MTFSANGVPLQNLFLQSYNTIDQYVGNTALTCGLNTSGQLGIGTTTTVSSFTQLGGSNIWAAIAFGDSTGFGLKNDGTLWSWGTNTGGALGNGVSGAVSSPVAVLTSNIKSFAASNDFGVAIRNDGVMISWGSNAFGQLGQGNTNNVSSPIALTGSTNWKQVSVLGNAAAAIKTDGTLWTWGANFTGQLGLGDAVSRSSPTQVGSASNWLQVSCGGSFMMAMKTDGSVWAWGGNSTGAFGNGTATSTSSPVQVVAPGSTWKQFNCFVDRTFATRIDNTLWAWGNNSNGILGLGDAVNRSSPTQIGSSANWKIAVSNNSAPTSGHVLAVKTDGTLWGWGTNTQGQLGLGNTSGPYSSPVQIGTFTNWKQPSAGLTISGAVTYRDDYQQ